MSHCFTWSWFAHICKFMNTFNRWNSLFIVLSPKRPVLECSFRRKLKFIPFWLTEFLKLRSHVLYPFYCEYRSSHRMCSIKNVKNSQKLQNNTCARNPFLINYNPQPTTLVKTKTLHRCFSAILDTFFKNIFYRTPPDCFCI